MDLPCLPAVPAPVPAERAGADRLEEAVGWVMSIDASGVSMAVAVLVVTDETGMGLPIFSSSLDTM